MSVEPTSVVHLRYECPVCMEMLFPPVFQCHNGHLMCEACSARLENCGVCRAILPQVDKVRNLEIERIIRMIQHRCPNEIDGCLVDVNFDQLEAHRLQCYYTKFPICRDTGLGDNCNEIRICDYQQHFDEKHNRIFGLYREPSNLPVTQDFSIWLMGLALEEAPMPITFKFFFEDKPTFFMVVAKLDAARDLLTWKPFVLAGRAVASQLNFKLSILSGQDVKFMMESLIFNVETQPGELLACPGLPWTYFGANFFHQTNKKGKHRLQIELSRKTETLPNEQENSATEST